MLKVKLPGSCVLVLVLKLVLVCSQSVQSPCPSIFDYESDGSRVYGKIILQGEATVTQLELQARFSVTGYIPNYGTIELINQKFALANFNQGSPLQYRVHFPEASSLPRVTAIVVNGNAICTGPDITPRPNRVITKFALKHVSYISGLQTSNAEELNFPASIQLDDDGIFYNEPYQVFNKPAEALEEYTPRPPRPPQPPRPPPTKRPTRPPETVKPFEEQSFTFEQTHTTTQRPKPVTTQKPVQPAPVQSQSEPDVECGTRSSQNNKLPLIYEGTSYRRGDMPWLVAIYKKKAGSLSFICGGTLVSNRHVVTAAHCLHSKGYTINDLVIKVGVHNINDWSDELYVTRTLLDAATPDSFENATLKNDILVLTFSRRVQFNAYIRPACLWDGDLALDRIVGTSGTVAGWGNQKNLPAGAGEPQSVNIPIVDTSTCRASNVAFHTLTSDKTICAGDRKGAGPCTGDSGGGLYLVDGGKWRLRGVVSVSLSNEVGNCNLKEYVVFTDAAQFLPWIRQVLKKEYYD